jgi:hypothetical protein
MVFASLCAMAAFQPCLPAMEHGDLEAFRAQVCTFGCPCPKATTSRASPLRHEAGIEDASPRHADEACTRERKCQGTCCVCASGGERLHAGVCVCGARECLSASLVRLRGGARDGAEAHNGNDVPNVREMAPWEVSSMLAQRAPLMGMCVCIHACMYA